MTVTVTKSYLPKTKPKSVIYRCYKTFVVDTFRYDLTNDLRASNSTLSYDEKHAPCKIKIIRANEAPFMNRELKKSIMTRSRLKNKYLRSPSTQNILAYKVQRNICTNLQRKRKRDYYNNPDTKLISLIIKHSGILLNLCSLIRLMSQKNHINKRQQYYF